VTSARLIFALALVAISTGGTFAQPKPADDDEASWRPAFDRAYGLADGEVLKHVTPPFVPARLKFYAATNRAQAEAVPEGPMTIVVRWNDGRPLIGHMRFSSAAAGMTLREVLENVVVLKGYEFDGPRELMDLELPGDWSVRTNTPKQALLEGLAKRLRAITARELSFEPEKTRLDVVVATGKPAVPADLAEGANWRLDLNLDDVELLESFAGGGRQDHLLHQLSRSTGWPVINETTEPDPHRPTYLTWSTGRPTAKPELERIGRDQLDRVLTELARTTGLELKVEQREVERWKLVEKE